MWFIFLYGFLAGIVFVIATVSGFGLYAWTHQEVMARIATRTLMGKK